jgi:C-terminal processing protease CtpA/Prc
MLNKKLLVTLTLWCAVAPLEFYGQAAQAANTYTAILSTNERFFSETGYTVKDRFLDYWNEHGDITQQGLPLSDELQELSETDGKVYTVQYFERAVFEYHPELMAPNDVLLSLVGLTAYHNKYPDGAQNQVPNTTTGSIPFSETDTRLGGAFLEYWQAHGGLAQNGLPISDEFIEQSDLNGKTYKVQYFERAVFEYHPENEQTPYAILLSHLGKQKYRSLYVLQVPSEITVPIPATISPKAALYLVDALAFIQANSIMRDRVDWIKLRRAVFSRAENATTEADTYPAIVLALDKLGDGHSGFLDPTRASNLSGQETTMGLTVSFVDRAITTVDSGSIAELAGAKTGDTIRAVNGKPIDQIDISAFFNEIYGGDEVDLMLNSDSDQPGSASHTVIIRHDYVDISYIPSGRLIEGKLGYINLPANGFSPIAAQYADIVQQLIRELDQTPICGWVTDLQANEGGNMWSMITGIGPVLGEGELGYFVSIDGERRAWKYSEGRAYNGDYAYPLVNNAYNLHESTPPVAVLTSRSTASSGEATLIAFRGRPQTRTFGAPTSGVPSANGGKLMSDGASVILTLALEMDRTGHQYGYNERIQPDQNVASRSGVSGTVGDPVMQAAATWLVQQPGCTN